MSNLLIKIVFNGELKSVSSKFTLLQILEQEGYPIPPDSKDAERDETEHGKRYIAAVNQRIISADDYWQLQLQPNDTIDVLGVITGG
ncbi:sulfur carrier protein ThiS [Thalassolituus oleivorans]|jgi:thiamine biosynthesis protein ThiS|uniref:sulfur carrier protein ThiS n=1 Tax=Thalassolituus oleivorans TaxID=187493 RepID=UPI001CE39E68|nr:MoaD/ThiS family protein [Thalassolituus oleivorans]MCA6128928.1 hypothetical protein [Thalassolituus oleivorans 4BN06-13]